MLRAYFVFYRLAKWLFEGQEPGEQYLESILQMFMKMVVPQVYIQKLASLHRLSHSYTTHLHESGTDIRFIL
jgi:integrase/recombinase XerD